MYDDEDDYDDFECISSRDEYEEGLAGLEDVFGSEAFDAIFSDD